MNPYLKMAYDYGAKHAQIMFEKYAQGLIMDSQEPQIPLEELRRRRGPVPEQFRNKGGINMVPGYGEWLQSSGARAKAAWLQSIDKQAGADATEAGDILARMSGAVPLAGPALSGQTGGIETAPGFGSHVGQRTAMGALQGQTLGGLGGAALGGGLGALSPYAGEALDIDALKNLEPSKGALIGALLGGGLGAGIGGSIGAGRGREKGEGEVAETQGLLQARRAAEMQQRLQQTLQQAYQRGGMEQYDLGALMQGGLGQ